LPKKPKPWGSICIGTRLEKQVEADFFVSWTGLLLRGLRSGDVVHPERGRVAHVAANEIIRAFLRGTTCDSLLFLDSDADVDPGFVTRFRDFEPGWKYDGFQAFYVRRGWPPEAIWFTRDGEEMIQCLVLTEGTMDVGLIGTHAAIFRREVFEKIYETQGKDKGIEFGEFHWFTYPRHERKSDEAMLSLEAHDLGFRLGATTAVEAGHIVKLSVGKKEYNDYLVANHTEERINYYQDLAEKVAEFTGETPKEVMGKAIKGNQNVVDGWKKYHPETPEELRTFYGAKDNGYLYDLLNWNWSEFYWKITEKMRSYVGKSTLVIGAGLGSEAAWMMNDNVVDVFELPGVLREFCKFRLGDGARILDGDTLTEATDSIGDGMYDVIVMIDTIEHLHPDEFDEVMGTVGRLLSLGGILYFHNNPGQLDLYPMHFDHTEKLLQWLKINNIERVNDYENRKAKSKKRLQEPGSNLSGRHRHRSKRSRSSVLEA